MSPKHQILGRIVRSIDHTTGPLIHSSFVAGACVTLIMVFLTVSDVLLRYLLNSPILGSYELSEYMLVVLVFSSLPYTERMNKHVKVDAFLSHFSKRSQCIIEVVTDSLGIAVLYLCAWENLKLGYRKWSLGEITGALPIPTFPMHLIISAGTILFGIALGVHLLQSIEETLKR